MTRLIQLDLWFRLSVLAAAALLVQAPSYAQQEDSHRSDYQAGQFLRQAPDSIVAIVDGRELHLSDLGDLLQELPASQRAIRFDTLYPALLDGLIEHAALELQAQRLGLDKDPAVARRMRAAAGRVLEQALLERIQRDKLTEPAVRALYDEIYSGKTAVDQIRLRLILLGSEAEAERALARLKAGEDFAAVARDMSHDASAAQGGDLGLLRREQLRPDLAPFAFALNLNETTPRPVRTSIGWCVMQVTERMSVPPPSYEAAHDEMRRLLLQRTIKAAAIAARSEATIKAFNMDGTAMTDHDGNAAVATPVH